MKIAIVGNGKVGLALTQQLVKEKHDIILIDNDKNRLQNAMDTLDVMCYCGNGASYRVLQEAGVEGADMLIAATSLDEINLLCCLMAKKLNVKNTIARIRNPEYSDQIQVLQPELGLSMTINPERATAREIARSLRFPAAIKLESFARGKIELVEIKVRRGSDLINASLSQVANSFHSRILVCAVQRGEDVFIPDGNFILQEGDRINFTASPNDITMFFKEMHIVQKGIKEVMIIGGSRIAYYLAQELLQLKKKVKIIESKPERCLYLDEVLPKADVICADGSDYMTLIEEGLETTDAVVALTGMDEMNIVISMYAQHCNVKKAVTKVNRITYMDILPQTGLETVISPKEITAHRIIQYVRAMQNSVGSSNVETMHKVVNEKVEALEFIIKKPASYLSIPFRDLKFKKETLVASIVRNGRYIIPNGDEVLRLKDRVLVVTTKKNMDDLKDVFE